MAQAVLGGLGAALGGGVGQAIGAALGRVADQALLGALAPARAGPRLETLRVQSSAEGAPMACVFGRARVTGQVIWAARFLERRQESGGGKGGPRTVDHAYSLSFAVALCEGPIDGVGRVWADGQPLDLSGLTMRVHRGLETQAPDPLIEAIEAGSAGGTGGAPAYRGTAYAVFEDLPLGPFGDRPPQLSFEVFRRPPGDGLEERLEGACLIPGAGEFALASQPVLRREGLTRTAAENVHGGDGRADLSASLDQLAAQAPNLKRVSLVIGWFGDDLRAECCTVRPGVERADKPTEPLGWSVAGLSRAEARVISEVNGRPAYGGTPSDETVRQAVAALKARGWAVTLYPFVFMDIPADNALPDPYGGARQAPHPWRGRIRGEDGAAAADAIAAVFGAADGWGLRRLALHYAALAAETGADGLLIGSEMRGLTWTRDADGGYPAVAAYRSLAAECRAIVGPGVSLSYAADWSEYSGHQPDDGSGDRAFHLDPLWADPNIDYVGIDWYAPLTDWRGGDGGLDSARFAGAADPAGLAAGVAGGEGFDWFYADEAARAAQDRTAIADTAHGEHWVFRPKDLVGWWSNPHHDRPGGVRSATPTAWVPGMKPIRLTEFGCAAVDRGGNAPNLFQDPKSSENALPPYSTGARDDRVQRRAIEAVLAHFAEPANNPPSPVYGGPMLAAADAWCWDARPYPTFPARADVWADAGAWRCGHWLNGRMTGAAADLVAAVLRRGGLTEEEFAVEGVEGEIAGYLIDRPMRTRDALAPLLQALGAEAAERDGRVAVLGGAPTARSIAPESLALPDEGAALTSERSLEPRPGAARVRFIDETADYQTGAVTLRGDGAGGGLDIDLPVVGGRGMAEACATRALAARGGANARTARLGPLEALRLEPGDAVILEGVGWRVRGVTLDEAPSARLTPLDGPVIVDAAAEWRIGEAPPAVGAPLFRLLDIPAPPGRAEPAGPVAVVAAEPWRPMEVHAGPAAETLRPRGRVARPATVGVLTAPLAPGPLHRWDEANIIEVRVEGPAPRSLPEAAVLGGGNAVAVETAAGWEIVQFQQAELAAGGVWRLRRLLRGQSGAEDEIATAAPGALAAFLDGEAAVMELAPEERGLPLVWRAGPAGWPAGGDRFSERSFAWRGLAQRPWRPVRLRADRDSTGWTLRWFGRSRTDAGWEAPEADADRFRIRVLDGSSEVRALEVGANSARYALNEAEADFPDGLSAARVAVAQWGEGFGWGAEAAVALA